MNIIYYIDTIKADSLGGTLEICGWSANKDSIEPKYILLLDDNEYKYTIDTFTREDVSKKYSEYINTGFKIDISVDLKCRYNSLKLVVKYGNESRIILEKNETELLEIIGKNIYKYNIDTVIRNKDDNNYEFAVTGWTFVGKGDEANVSLFDAKSNEKINYKLKKILRLDLEKLGVEVDSKQLGFELEYKAGKKNNVILQFDSSKYSYTKKINLNPYPITIIKPNKMDKILIFFNAISLYNFKKAIKYIKKNGLHGLKTAITNNISGDKNTNSSYDEWFEKNKAKKRELNKQIKLKYDYEPLISILVPTYNTPRRLLIDMIESVIAQTYSNWELCIADGSNRDNEAVNILEEYKNKDLRIKVSSLKDNLGIAGNTNKALNIATGDFIGLLDHDDILAPNALFEVVGCLQDKITDVVYTDEDKINDISKIHTDPNFKPDFNIDLLTTHNYITHFFVAKKTIIDEIGGFRSEYDGAQDFDLIFRCVEKGKKIQHVSKVLYHWRICAGSTAENPESKMYAYDAGKRAIEDHFRRIGIDANVEITENLLYKSKIKVIGSPLVSILIPNKDHIEDLDKCIQSIKCKSTYDNYEIIIIENNSEEEDTFKYYEEIQNMEKCKVVYWNDDFNYSAINNFGVENAAGEYLIMLNNDTEIITNDWIEEMLSYCQREDVGIVGAKLYYEDDTIQHAGVILGVGGVAGHAAVGLPRNAAGYMSRPITVQDMTAVTAACLMIKRSVFEEVKGFDTKFKVAFNDIDLCMKVRKQNYLVVYNPNVELYHYESKSRGYEDTPEKIRRFTGEIISFRSKWEKELEKGDPYYNKNLSLTSVYSLKEKEEQFEFEEI